jgi:SSS family solute:Na+ symporter
MTSMVLGCVFALAFMVKDGIDANTPIYYSLAAALFSFVIVSLFSRPTALDDAAAATKVA